MEEHMCKLALIHLTIWKHFEMLTITAINTALHGLTFLPDHTIVDDADATALHEPEDYTRVSQGSRVTVVI